MTLSSSYEIYIRSESSPEDYQAALNKIIELDREIFMHNNADDSALNELFRDPADEDTIAVLIKLANKVVGYGFVKIITVEVEGKPVKAFQPLSGILPKYVGNNIGRVVWLKTFLQALRICGWRAYMVAFVMNPGIYRYITNVSHRLYPSPYNTNCLSNESVALKSSIDCWKVPVAQGLENARYFVTTDVEVAHKRSFNPRCKNDHFFMAYNHGYQKGRYLGICTKVTGTRILVAILRTIRIAMAKRRDNKQIRSEINFSLE